MAGQPFILGTVESVIGKALFLLQMKNKCPDFMLADVSYIFASPLNG